MITTIKSLNGRSVRRNASGLLTFILAVSLVFQMNAIATAHYTMCPFCSAASQTLRQELQSMDAVAIGKLVPGESSEIDGLASFKIEKVLIGDSLLAVDQVIQATYFGPGISIKDPNSSTSKLANKKFLLMGVDPKELVWSSPLALSEAAEKYVEQLKKLPEDPIERLAFYQSYFEHADNLLARDSYDEFALAPYGDVVRLKDRMDRKQLLAWVQDPSKSPDRKRLYYTMLGICGQPEDGDLFEKMIVSEKQEDRAGLDALIAAYLTLKGEKGLPLISDKFFKDTKTPYADIYSAVMALRFHGTELELLKKDSITKTMHQLLARPDLADLVIPDLARWGDWSQIDRLCELFAKANDDNMWVRVPVINYLRSCPLPAAQEKLIELEKIDPKAVSRAKTFFPIPTPAATKKGESSALPVRNFQERALVLHALQKSIPLAANPMMSCVPVMSVDIKTITGARSANAMNLVAPLLVLVITTVMMALAMWILATSGGTSLRYAYSNANPPERRQNKSNRN